MYILRWQQTEIAALVKAAAAAAVNHPLTPQIKKRKRRKTDDDCKTLVFTFNDHFVNKIVYLSGRDCHLVPVCE